MAINQQIFVDRFTALANQILTQEGAERIVATPKEIVDGKITEEFKTLWEYCRDNRVDVDITPCYLRIAFLALSAHANFSEKDEEELIEEMIALVVKKNHDYAGERDPLLNLRMSEAAGIPAWVGIAAVRLADKYSRVKNFFESEVLKVKSESVEDTLIDMANYSILGIIAFEDWLGKFEDKVDMTGRVTKDTRILTNY